jgi:O-antigen/teichoic acid export membrane protein
VASKDLDENLNEKKRDKSRKQIRGSGLLLAGRFISLSFNFLTQVLIVRHLSQSDYGAWAYCLSLIALFQSFSTFGLKRAVTRFIPIYHEEADYGKLFGILALVSITIVITGFLFIGTVHWAPGIIEQLIKDNTDVLKILLILIFLVPVEAIDSTLNSIFASFYKTRAIFFRGYILAPLLKISVVFGLILSEGSVFFLAYGYLIVGIIVVVIYFPMLIRMLKKEGVSQHFSLSDMNIPAKEVFSFALPLLTSDLVIVALHSTDTLMLGYFHSTEEVALYQVILPLAHVNTIVMASFGTLYTPTAARLFARRDFTGISKNYWQTATWLAVLSFPLFALTFVSAKPLTELLYGERYADSWVYLQIMAGAYYFHVLLGFNGLTLKVLGKVKYVVIINLLAVMINVILNIILIPRYGALGATMGTAGSMFCHNLLKQFGLLKAGVTSFDKQNTSLYLSFIVATSLLFLTQLFFTDKIYILVPLTIVSSFIIIRMSAHKLKIEETFPELMKIPLMRFILGSS